ncbi:MAG: hypothetical protein RLZZ626_416 [Actinomycetota bacterium]|jgi:CrcB protein
MNPLFLLTVAVAGGFGSVLRLVASKWTGYLPWGIMAANVLASGLAMFAKAGLGSVYPNTPAGFSIAIGVAGGFSTFSAFIAQTAEYFRRRQLRRAGLNILLTFVLSSTAVIGVLQVTPALLK